MHKNRETSKLELFSWMLYDFANTAFTVMIVTFLYSTYFKSIVCKGLGNTGDLLWGLNGTISMLLAASIAPVLGAIADCSQMKKRFLIIFALVAIFFSSTLFFVKEGMIFWGMFLFIIANIGYQGGNVFYNAFLPEITTREKLGTISGYGWALGYVGAFAIILLSAPLLTGGFEAGNLANIRLSFVLQAVFYLIFSLPIFFLLRERGKIENAISEKKLYVRTGFERLRQTFKNIRQYKELFKFLIAYFFYIEGVTTVIFFSTIYAKDTLGFTIKELIKFYLLVQGTGIAGALFFGWLSDKMSPKKTITMTLIIWCIVIIGAYATTSKEFFWYIGILAGLAMGSSQSVSRSMMGLLTPEDKHAEFFSFYGVSSKLSAAVGPFVFGALSAAFSSQRIAILGVGVFFVIGLVILQFVKEE